MTGCARATLQEVRRGRLHGSRPNRYLRRHEPPRRHDHRCERVHAVRNNRASGPRPRRRDGGRHVPSPSPLRLPHERRPAGGDRHPAGAGRQHGRHDESKRARRALHAQAADTCLPPNRSAAARRALGCAPDTGQWRGRRTTSGRAGVTRPTVTDLDRRPGRSRPRNRDVVIAPWELSSVVWADQAQASTTAAARARCASGGTLRTGVDALFSKDLDREPCGPEPTRGTRLDRRTHRRRNAPGCRAARAGRLERHQHLDQDADRGSRPTR